ncbi:MAG: hypothetical protein J5I93_30520 [Pirellulaceae bacterium]|nr:hypothetical protein [Pirellulaceae bacterium]
MKSFLPVIVFVVLTAGFMTLDHRLAFADEVSDLREEVVKLKAALEELQSQMALVESERDALRLRVKRMELESARSESDLFQAGMRWEGTRFLAGQKGRPRDEGQNWSLVVTQRDGERFKGQIQFVSRDKQTQQLEVSGSAPTKTNGRVVFKTDAIGVLQQSFDGVLKGNQISLTWEGTGVAGKRLAGTANLSR